MPHHVVTGALLGPRGILLGHRRPDRAHYPDCWDLPGGHVEPGESAPQALARELREELGVRAVVTGAPVARILENAESPDGLDLRIWAVTGWVGEPGNLAPGEHDALRWFRAPELAALHLAHPRYTTLLPELLGEETAAGR